jgi:tyrosine-protein kinase Etk/Wzc
MSEQLGNKQPSFGTTDAEKIHLLDLMIILALHKRLVLGTTLFTGTLAMVVSVLITPSFTSTAKIMPPQQQQNSGVAAMLGQLGGLAAATGGLAGLKTTNDLYIGLLESRTVSDSLIARFKLKERYATSTMEDTRTVLNSVSDIINGKKDGMISISTSDKDPQFAADLANAYVDELAKLTQTMALTEASQRRLFFEKQLKDTRNQLATAEVALRTTQEKTGMIQPDAQVQAIIANLAQMKGAIAAKEVELNAMRIFATSSNPDLMRAQEELRGLQAQLSKLEKSQPSKDGDFLVPTGKIPEIGVEYVRGVRNVKYHETIFEVLAKQFELAKIDEAKESTSIQLLDRAVPAERRSKPRRAIITLEGIFGGLLLGIVLAFLREGYLRSRLSPAGNHRWEKLSASWRKTHGEEKR